MPDELDAFADLPPEEFVAARDELAKRLKAEGDVARAATVKQLRKPTVTEWIVAQVHRHHEREVEGLRAASRDVAEAQEAAITSGDRDALRNANAKRQDAVRVLEGTFDGVLARSGRPAHHRDDVLSAIEADVIAEIATGTFGVRDDLQLPERVRKEPGRDLAAERLATEAKAAIERAEARVGRARDELEKAEAALAEVVESSRGVEG